ncbi:histidine kinase [Microbacterium lacus]|uniref:sensor histidine kinase n=1 Tax=Microbacterium lacus TaxID=415217 RepID=UPI00384BC0FD
MRRVPTSRTRRLAILVMQCVVVLACVAVTGGIATLVQERSIRTATEERVLDVAQSLAELSQVQTAVTGDRAMATAELQPVADLIEAASGVDYVVITDAAGIRVTHPTPSERGLPVSTDLGSVLDGETFLGTESGTIGPTLRAKVPIIVDGEIVGATSVGILESTIAADFDEAVASLVPWMLGAVLLGCLASALLTSVLNRRLRRLEVDALELDTQRRIAAALRDQTHEFRTRMHVVHGLIARDENAEALTYIRGVVPVSDGPGAGADIDDPTLRALLAALSADLDALGAALTVDELSTVERGSVHDDDLVVVSNLCRNAGEAGARAVGVMVRSDHENVVVVVEDDGPGILPADVARVFERGVTSKSDESGTGRGVGLDVVRRIVNRRKGTVEVGRSASGGARFIVDMPAASATRVQR